MGNYRSSFHSTVQRDAAYSGQWRKRNAQRLALKSYELEMRRQTLIARLRLLIAELEAEPIARYRRTPGAWVFDLLASAVRGGLNAIERLVAQVVDVVLGKLRQ